MEIGDHQGSSQASHTADSESSSDSNMLSVIPFDRLSQDLERSFKAYPRTPISLPSSYYSAYATNTYSNTLGLSLPTSKPSESTMADMTNSYRSSYNHQTPQHTMDIAQSVSNRGLKSEDMGSMDNYHSHHQMAYSQNHMHLSHLSHPSSSSAMTPPAHNINNNHSQMALSVSQPQHPTHPISSHPSPVIPIIPKYSRETPDSTENLHASFKIPPKKRAQPVPEEKKDGTYWEKRKKNNDSAKRSRDMRRKKEEQISVRVVYLEQENLQLRTEVSLLKGEIEKLRCMLYNSS